MPALLPSLAGLPRLDLARLDDAASLAVLRDVSDEPIADEVARDLVHTSGGNPLALRELPAALTPAQRAGLEPPALRLPHGSAVERAFTTRFDGPRRRRAARADGRRGARVAGRRRSRWRRSIGWGWSCATSRPARRRGCCTVERGHVSFRHPLLRSLAYHAATSSARLAAHRALADVATDPAVRAWHLSAAAIGPDGHAAAALDLAAEDARVRGASTEAAAASHRAAELSASNADAVRRFTLAATDLALAGRAERRSARSTVPPRWSPAPEQDGILRDPARPGRHPARRARRRRDVLVGEGEALA